ncbi:MAG TPA: DoxX family protein [Actinomycetales bacterium]|nr:DoxX family protein [Actinomycetales bacterium]
MTIVRRIARPLLAAQFVDGGLDQFRHPATKVDRARPVVDKIAEPLRLPNDPELLVRANGAAMAGAGLLFGIGKLPRLSALVLAATLVPTTYAGHAFWTEKDAAKRKQQKVHFLKNVGLLGGVLIASVDTEGRPGLLWRSQHAASSARRTARHAKKDAKRATREAKRETQRAARRAGDAVGID